MSNRRSQLPSTSSSSPLTSESRKNTTDGKPSRLSYFTRRTREFFRSFSPTNITSPLETQAPSTPSTQRSQAISRDDTAVNTSSSRKNRSTISREPLFVAKRSGNPPDRSPSIRPPSQTSQHCKMTEPPSPTDTSIQKASNRTAQRRKLLREEKDAQERHEVTRENDQKTTELVREGISVRDFALEALERERAERNERADEYQALRRGGKEKELEDARVRELLGKDDEEDEEGGAGEDVRRKREGSESQSQSSAGRDWGERMDAGGDETLRTYS